MTKGASEFLGTDSYKSREQTGETRSEYTGRVTERHYSDVNYSRDVNMVTYHCKNCGYRKYKEKVGRYRKA